MVALVRAGAILQKGKLRAGEERGSRIEDRLLELGATRHPRSPEPDDDFTVLEDPGGNLFCVTPALEP